MNESADNNRSKSESKLKQKIKKRNKNKQQQKSEQQTSTNLAGNDASFFQESDVKVARTTSSNTFNTVDENESLRCSSSKLSLPTSSSKLSLPTSSSKLSLPTSSTSSILVENRSLSTFSLPASAAAANSYQKTGSSKKLGFLNIAKMIRRKNKSDSAIENLKHTTTSDVGMTNDRSETDGINPTISPPVVDEMEEEKLEDNSDGSEQAIKIKIEEICQNYQKSNKPDFGHAKSIVQNDPEEFEKYNIPELKSRLPSIKQILTFKIIFVGQIESGKTSIVNRLMHNVFSPEYQTTTIGFDCCTKIIPWDDDKIITLHLWDTAGQEQYMNLLKAYYKEADGVFVVSDLTKPNSMEAAVEWKNHVDINIQMMNSRTAPCILLANKCDHQLKSCVKTDNTRMVEFCKTNNFTTWFETSAKNNINIDESLNCLIDKILISANKEEEEKNLAAEDAVDNKPVKLIVEREQPPDKAKSQCSC